MPRGERVKLFLRGLARLVALVVVAGGIGVALGMGLSALSADEEPAATGGDAATPLDTEVDAAQTPTGSTQPAAPVPAQTTTATVPVVPVGTTTTADAPSGRFAQVRVSVLDSRLFTDSTPSGREEQRSRVTVRIRAENRGFDRVTLDAPTLRVGSVRIPVDPAGDQFAPLQSGADLTVTVRFELAGDATPKVVRDRRARILVAGRSLPIRVRVQAPRE
jgi:hypothetical protein